MGNIHLKTSSNGGNINFKDPTMPKYVGARAKVTRTEEGVKIWMSDYKGTTTETIAEAIADIVTNNDGSLTFVLPDGREITTDSLKGEQGPAGADGADGQDGQDGQDGADGVGIASIEKTGTSGLVDTYTITYTDSDTDTFTVTNGADGQPGTTDYNELTNKPTIPDAVSVTQITSTGTNIADITIGSTTTHLYAPSGGGSDDVYVTDMYTGTYSDVLTAYQAGKLIFLLDPNSNAVAPLASVTLSSGDVTSFNFVQVINPATTVGYHLNNSSQWSVDDTNTPIANTFQAYYGSTTSAEIEHQYQLGKIVYVLYSTNQGEKVFFLNNRANSVTHEFACLYDYDGYLVTPIWDTLVCANDFWSNTANRLARYEDMPTKVSDLNNDSGYLTLATLPTYNGGVS